MTNFGEREKDYGDGGAKKDKVQYAYVGETFVNYCFLFKLKYFTGNIYIGKLVDV